MDPDKTLPTLFRDRIVYRLRGIHHKQSPAFWPSFTAGDLLRACVGSIRAGGILFKKRNKRGGHWAVIENGVGYLLLAAHTAIKRGIK